MTPKARLYNKDRRTTTLYWGREEQGEYYLRGGVCWPVSVETAGGIDAQGYALLIGQDVSSKAYRVFKQCEFVTVDHILEDGIITYPGVATWFNDCWSQYFARTFYWHQDDELTRSYRLDVWRSDTIVPKPSLVNVDWSDDGAALHLIWRLVKTRKLFFKEGSVLDRQLKGIKKGDKGMLPAVHALACALAGMVRHPFREPRSLDETE